MMTTAAPTFLGRRSDAALTGAVFRLLALTGETRTRGRRTRAASSPRSRARGRRPLHSRATLLRPGTTGTAAASTAARRRRPRCAHGGDGFPVRGGQFGLLLIVFLVEREPRSIFQLIDLNAPRPQHRLIAGRVGHVTHDDAREL